MKREQQHIFDTLQARRIPFHAIDIAAPESGAVKMMLRERSPRQLALPQVWVENAFRTDYTTFVEALENDLLESLLAPQGDAEFPLH